MRHKCLSIIFFPKCCIFDFLWSSGWRSITLWGGTLLDQLTQPCDLVPSQPILEAWSAQMLVSLSSHIMIYLLSHGSTSFPLKGTWSRFSQPSRGTLNPAADDHGASYPKWILISVVRKHPLRMSARKDEGGQPKAKTSRQGGGGQKLCKIILNGKSCTFYWIFGFLTLHSWTWSTNGVH